MLAVAYRRNIAFLWCPGPDSNRHTFRRGILSPLRLPISPPGLGEGSLAAKERIMACFSGVLSNRGKKRRAKQMLHKTATMAICCNLFQVNK